MIEIAPHVAKMDREGCLHDSILPALFNAGMMGIEVEEEYTGGGGMTFTQACIAVEEIAKIDPAVSVIVDIHNTLNVNAIRKYGNADQRSRFLPRLATTDVSSFCISEASSGSDAFALKTTAKLSSDGTHYNLNGSKMWISNAKEAGLFLIFANANPHLGYKGITAFIVERDTPGLVVGKKEDKLGIRASSTCELILDEVRVPKQNVLGDLGQGYRIAIESLNEGRIGIGAQMIGLAQGAMDATLPYLRQRKQARLSRTNSQTDSKRHSI